VKKAHLQATFRDIKTVTNEMSGMRQAKKHMLGADVSRSTTNQMQPIVATNDEDQRGGHLWVCPASPGKQVTTLSCSMIHQLHHVPA